MLVAADTAGCDTPPSVFAAADTGATALAGTGTAAVVAVSDTVWAAAGALAPVVVGEGVFMPLSVTPSTLTTSTPSTFFSATSFSL